MKTNKIKISIISLVLLVLLVGMLVSCGGGGLPKQKATIVGTITGYSGDAPVIIIAYNNSAMKENKATRKKIVNSENKMYTLELGHGEWWIVAFADENGDMIVTAGEPSGKHTSNPIALSEAVEVIEGVDIEIND
jgi:hypothetical protein